MFSHISERHRDCFFAGDTLRLTVCRHSRGRVDLGAARLHPAVMPTLRPNMGIFGDPEVESGISVYVSLVVAKPSTTECELPLRVTVHARRQSCRSW